MSLDRQLVWLRSDLRASDNTALYHASQAGQVICVYLLFPEQWSEHGDGANKLFFWMKNLHKLKEKLHSLNIPLIVHKLSHFADSTDELLTLSNEMNCQGLWFNDEYGLNERQRDERVEQAFLQKSLPCHRFTDQLLFAPGTVLNGQGEFFKVFTPFKKQLYRQLDPESIRPLPQPERQPSLKFTTPDSDAIERIYQPTASGIEGRWPPGEAAAQKSLRSFITERADHYQQDRDIPSVTGTSSLSPWLNAGVLSIRQCFYDALMANDGELDSGSKGLACWMSELIWREFYKHILEGFPRISRGSAFVENTDQLPWQYDMALFDAWKNGRTGYPLVDAAMQQLVQTGWMHNRLRMVSAMFLSKNLMLDWRLGEQFFMEHLVDGDLAANNGGWQWSASTGTDAAPYFRMFNPESQSRKFDPEGHFIRQWLPSLADLDSRSIHAPHANGNSGQLDYPLPVVDHKLSREKVIEAFKALKQFG